MGSERYVRTAGGFINLRTGLPFSSGGGGVGGDWGPQLGPGILATADNVGFRGDITDLTVLAPGGALPPSLGTAHWDGTAIIVNGDPALPRSLEGFRVRGCVVSSVPLVAKHNLVECRPGDFYGITGNSLAADIRVEDTTVVGTGNPSLGPSSNSQVNAISSDGRVTAIRCKSTGTSDCIHGVYRGTDKASGGLISQCWNQPTFLDDAQHCDGYQLYNPPGVGYFTIEYSAIAAGVYGPTGDSINASITSAAPAGSSNPHLYLVGNSIPAGGFHLMAGDGLHLHAVNNNFGLVDAAHGEFGLVSVTSDVVEWTGNVDGNGNPVNP